MRNNFLFLTFAAACVLPATAAPVSAPIVIKFSHVVAPENAKGQAAEMFKKLAEKLTKGRVKVELYPNSSLYKDADELDALVRGDVQILAPALGKMNGLGLPEFEVFDLPYLFADRSALYRVTEGKIGKNLLQRLEAKGVVGLAIWDNGFKDMSANTPLLKPSDFKSLKMRILNSQVIGAQMRVLGATPKTLNFADTLQGLKSGTVSGTENPPSNMYSQKIHEVQKYMTVSNHAYLGYAVIANKAFWDGLPADIRVSLMVAMQEATGYEKVAAKFDNDRALEAIRKAGKTDVYVLSQNEQVLWREATAPVYRQMEERIGKQLLDAVVKEAAGN